MPTPILNRRLIPEEMFKDEDACSKLWTFLFRRESKATGEPKPKLGSVRVVHMQLSVNTELKVALKKAESNGVTKMSKRTGCFEVQTPHGVYYHVRGSRIDLDTAQKRANVVFKTWQALTEE